MHREDKAMARSTNTPTAQPAVGEAPDSVTDEQPTPDATEPSDQGDVAATPDATEPSDQGDVAATQDATEQAGDAAPSSEDLPEQGPLSDDEYVARVRAGYGRECAACERKMLGGQGLTLNEYREPIHRSCA